VTIRLPPTKPLLLDTSVLIHFLRGQQTGRLIEEKLRLSERRGDSILSSVVEAELLLIAARRNWDDRKLADLAKQCRDFVRVSAGEPAVVQAWVDIARAQTNAGEKMEQNDLWIAATARAAGAVLITCDGDFLRLRPGLVSYCHVDQNTGTATLVEV
jgi:tRNA(fMet)-specific endonuclease VapC